MNEHAIATLERSLDEAKRGLPDLQKKVKEQERWLGEARRAVWIREARMRSLAASIAILKAQKRA